MQFRFEWSSQFKRTLLRNISETKPGRREQANDSLVGCSFVSDKRAHVSSKTAKELPISTAHQRGVQAVNWAGKRVAVLGIVLLMPINGTWLNPGVNRCYGKKRYRNWDCAETAAEKASLRTGELIVAHECPDCHKVHIGHADQISDHRSQVTP